MCLERSTATDMSDKEWRGYNKLEHLIRLIFSPIVQMERITIKRTVYLITALVAFALGLSLGLLIPVYIMPVSIARNVSSIMRSVRPISSSSQRFDTVSFVAESTTIRAQQLRPKDSRLVVDGIYWNDEIEAALPTGYGEPEAERWRRFVKNNPVVKIEEGCGRMQNRLLTFEDGTRACCRYRQNTDQIQGELFSFYLGRLLGLNNLAPSALGVVHSRDPVWSKVRAQISLAQWAEERPVVLTKFIDYLQPAQIPRSLRNSNRKLHPPDVNHNDRSKSVELAQWSDLIVFDYLTANLDRIVNNLYNLQWNPGMMDAPAHNLAKCSKSNLLLFLDNESGLLHGYRLLDKYESYHSVLLNALCVFRRSTVEAIERLRNDQNLANLLERSLNAEGDLVPGLPEKNLKILNDRINRVHDQVEWCRKQYS
ncbi:four-jointed box kinase [Rhodnius prolixus]